ncbi:endonuclease/exonuclease/phosphatase family protein [Hoeflea sp. YIM 152468]|uniref:endonuclease/exonuclease/phosphatase family protein n=1 Tax=Hoeflea sp. YIM 152468 TaxID=3031759 RepID=UPI0023D9ADD6|nr:endonuclease/exonuclease/phosphatase family protein [Hoeflea sp. YIM 152468]MDF1608942.1 endonuclease/exonuclease/phosphatase family protein [Hoeflea sp. YIM 152468]
MVECSESGEKNTASISVATYNVRKAIGGDYRRDPERVLEAVANLGVDIVALQEADYRFKQRKPIFSSSQVRHHTQLHTVSLNHNQNGLGWHGNILLVNPDLRILDARTIELKGLEPRGGLLVDLAHGDTEIRVICAHLGLLAAYRRRQAETLVEAADPGSGRVTLMMGDFNCWGKGRWSLKPFRDCMQEAECGKTFPAGFPVAALDQIFYAGPLQLKSAGRIQTGLTRMASDHLPVRAQFDIGAAAAPDAGRPQAQPALA